MCFSVMRSGNYYRILFLPIHTTTGILQYYFICIFSRCIYFWGDINHHLTHMGVIVKLAVPRPRFSDCRETLSFSMLAKLVLETFLDDDGDSLLEEFLDDKLNELPALLKSPRFLEFGASPTGVPDLDMFSSNLLFTSSALILEPGWGGWYAGERVSGTSPRIASL